jgi:hypothetical protein
MPGGDNRRLQLRRTDPERGPRANTTNPADWLRISEKKDERIVYIGAPDHYWTSSAARAGHRHRVEVGQCL